MASRLYANYRGWKSGIRKHPWIESWNFKNLHELLFDKQLFWTYDYQHWNNIPNEDKKLCWKLLFISRIKFDLIITISDGWILKITVSPLPVPKRSSILSEIIFHVKNIVSPLYCTDIEVNRPTYVWKFSLRVFEKKMYFTKFSNPKSRLMKY